MHAITSRPPSGWTTKVIPGASQNVASCLFTVTGSAAASLGRIGDPRAVEPLSAALKDGKHEALAALVLIDPVRAVEPLIAALGAISQQTYSDAAAALAKIGDTRAVEPLIEACEDRDIVGRQPFTKALEKFGAAAVEPLIAALSNENWQIRDAAVCTLGSIGDARAVKPLIAALKDKVTTVRLMAVLELGRIGDAQAVEPLTEVLKDIYLRSAATKALEQIKYKS